MDEPIVLSSDDEGSPAPVVSRTKRGRSREDSLEVIESLKRSRIVSEEPHTQEDQACAVANAGGRSPSTSLHEGEPATRDTETPTGPSSERSAAFLNTGLSRFEMEQERLQRQKQWRQAQATKTGQKPELQVKEEKHPHVKSTADSPRFWSGSIERVHNRYSSGGASFSFADIIRDIKPEITMAVVVAFELDIEWVMSHFDDPNVPLLLVSHDGGGVRTKDPQISVIKTARPTPNVFHLNPVNTSPWQGGGCMHIKLIVHIFDLQRYSASRVFSNVTRLTQITQLFGKTFARVVIPTANAVAFDWDTIDNSFYIHDFPRINDKDIKADPRDNLTHTSFSRELVGVLMTLQIPKRFIGPFRDYDFSSTAEVRLVVSKQGLWKYPYEGGGLSSLAEAVSSLDVNSHGRWQVEACCSSIGKYTQKWLQQMYGACRGISPAVYFSKNSPIPDHQPDKVPLKLVYPTSDEVLSHSGGATGGGTLFCRRNQWESKGFPQYLFHRYNIKRKGAVSHAKFIVGINPDDDYQGWVYVGSHNFTPSAWGHLQIARERGTRQLSLNNYEMGVLLKLKGSNRQEREAYASGVVPYMRPLQKYSSSDVPWFQDEHYRL